MLLVGGGLDSVANAGVRVAMANSRRARLRGIGFRLSR